VRDSFPSHGSSTYKGSSCGGRKLTFAFTIMTDCQYNRNWRAHQLKTVICFPFFQLIHSILSWRGTCQISSSVQNRECRARYPNHYSRAFASFSILFQPANSLPYG